MYPGSPPVFCSLQNRVIEPTMYLGSSPVFCGLQNGVIEPSVVSSIGLQSLQCALDLTMSSVVSNIGLQGLQCTLDLPLSSVVSRCLNVTLQGLQYILDLPLQLSSVDSGGQNVEYSVMCPGSPLVCKIQTGLNVRCLYCSLDLSLGYAASQHPNPTPNFKFIAQTCTEPESKIACRSSQVNTIQFPTQCNLGLPLLPVKMCPSNKPLGINYQDIFLIPYCTTDKSPANQ